MSRASRLLPLLLAALSLLAAFVGPSMTSRLAGWLTAFFLAVALVTTLRGRWQNVAVVLASLLFGLTALEGVATILRGGSGGNVDRAFTQSHPVLGWGPAPPGSYHVRREDRSTHAVIYDQTYTLGEGGRKTVSREGGATVAFLGDSVTFGEGLADSETLPQAFAELEHRQVRVVNLGFPGYGPQQVLRAVETGLYDPILGHDLRAIVFVTMAWHAERSSCKASFAARGPRYEMRDGKLVFAGRCAEGLSGFLRRTIGETALFRTFLWPVAGTTTSEDLDFYVKMLAQVAAAARERYKTPFVLAYFPVHELYFKGTSYSHSKIVDGLRAAGTDVLELPFNQIPSPDNRMFIPGDGHPSAYTTELWAGLVKKHLEEIGVSLKD